MAAGFEPANLSATVHTQNLGTTQQPDSEWTSCT